MDETNSDRLYFVAVERASQGQIEGRAVEILLAAARKFAAVDLPEESARFFERLYQILQTSLSNGYQPNDRQIDFFRSIIEEYCHLLLRLERHERLAVMRQILTELQQAKTPSVTPPPVASP